MDNDDKNAKRNEFLESEHPSYALVTILPLFFLTIFLIFLFISLSKSEQKRVNILRIVFYVLVQFICMPFLIFFIFINAVLISISLCFFKKLNYISTKNTIEFFKVCFKCCFKKEITTIKVGKKLHSLSIPSRSDNYKEVNNDSNNNEKSLNLNKIDNLNLNNVNNLRINQIPNPINKVKFEKDNKKNMQIDPNNKQDDDKNKEIKNVINNTLTNAIPNSTSNGNNGLNCNEDVNNRTNNKVNIFINMQDNRPIPTIKKVDKGKIMNFLSGVLVNKDNTPSYINIFKNIKDKTKEKLQNEQNNPVVIFNK